MGVRYTHPEYDEMSPLWARCRDAVEGQDEMHEAGERYLPKLKAEDPTDYAARVNRADYFNASWRTIAGLTGMAFSKPPAVELPAAIEAFKEDIDLAGCSLDALAKTCVEEMLEVGRGGLLVDHPSLPENVLSISKAAAETLGMRPSIKFYCAESIRNWKFDRIANRQVLTMVVLGEEAQIPKDEFESECEDRYRVLDLDEAGNYRQRVFAVRDQKDVLVEGPIYPLMNSKPLTSIPFLILGADGKGDEIDVPPLIDLIDANIAHYQINADYRHGLHFTALPTLFLAGVTQEPGSQPFYLGGQAAITANDPNAKGMFIEFTGQGLGALQMAIKDKEQQMAVLGARMIADETKHVETATGTIIKRQGESSILARVVIAVGKAIEAALGIMAEWVGASGTITYEINRDFTPVPMDAQQLTALVGAWQSGALSESELFDMLKRGDVIEPSKDLEAHQEEIAANPAVPKPAPVAPVPPGSPAVAA